MWITTYSTVGVDHRCVRQVDGRIASDAVVMRDQAALGTRADDDDPTHRRTAALVRHEGGELVAEGHAARTRAGHQRPVVIGLQPAICS